MKRIIQYVCAGCLLVLSFPIGIYAESATYAILSAGCYTYWDISNPYKFSVSTDARYVILAPSSSTRIMYIVSDSSFMYWTGRGDNCAANTYTPYHINDYYLTTINLSGLTFGPEYGIPTITATNDTTTAIYYTYGAGAVDPEPEIEPIDYGDLLDVRFNTSIAGSGAASVSNIDHITWNPDSDSNGNVFDDTARVQIKAIAGNYQSNSRNGLLGLGATSFDYNNGAEHMLAEYPAQRGKYDVTWSHVMDQLNAGSWSDFLGIRKSDDVWLKSGWIYQIRLVVGDYESAWKTIYNSTSAGVQNALNVENSVELNYSLVNTIVEINEMNESTYESWMINNTIINMENSDDQQQTDKPWWAYLLEAIVGLISGVLDFLGNLIGDLIGAIVDLFTFDSFDLDVILNFGQEQRESNNIIGQSLNFFDNVVEAAQDMRQSDLIISYPGITLFNVELLPAADYNLNQYVSDLGLTDFHNLAYLVTDGTIAICLISLVYRKIMGILRS